MSIKCPRCGSAELHQSSSGPEENAFHILQVPFRCEVCDERFWILSLGAWRLIIFIVVFMIAVATIALLMPANIPEGPKATTSAAPSDAP